MRSSSPSSASRRRLPSWPACCRFRWRSPFRTGRVRPGTSTSRSPRGRRGDRLPFPCWLHRFSISSWARAAIRAPVAACVPSSPACRASPDWPRPSSRSRFRSIREHPVTREALAPTNRCACGLVVSRPVRSRSSATGRSGRVRSVPRLLLGMQRVQGIQASEVRGSGIRDSMPARFSRASQGPTGPGSNSIASVRIGTGRDASRIAGILAPGRIGSTGSFRQSVVLPWGCRNQKAVVRAATRTICAVHRSNGLHPSTGRTGSGPLAQCGRRCSTRPALSGRRPCARPATLHPGRSRGPKGASVSSRRNARRRVEQFAWSAPTRPRSSPGRCPAWRCRPVRSEPSNRPERQPSPAQGGTWTGRPSSAPRRKVPGGREATTVRSAACPDGLVRRRNNQKEKAPEPESSGALL
jgi:hypothetical protein